MTIQEMIARQQAIVTQARNEGRGLSREEQTEFDQLQGKIDAARAAGGQEGTQGGAEPPADGSRGAGDPAGAEGQDGGSDATRQAVEAERQRNSDKRIILKMSSICELSVVAQNPFRNKSS